MGMFEGCCVDLESEFDCDQMSGKCFWNSSVSQHCVVDEVCIVECIELCMFIVHQVNNGFIIIVFSVDLFVVVIIGIYMWSDEFESCGVAALLFFEFLLGCFAFSKIKVLWVFVTSSRSVMVALISTGFHLFPMINCVCCLFSTS